MALCKIVLGDCTDLLKDGIDEMREAGFMPVIVTDPPFNIGYRYKSYKDKMPEGEYYKWLASLTSDCASVIIHYPESLHKISIAKGEAPIKVATWVYNSNTAKQHRDIAFYGVKPDFRRVKQPYKNPNDKRIRALMEQGRGGARLYDWWNINQVKNVSREKTEHPCQMPIDVMSNIIGILPDNIGVIDPFAGSGTTAIACALRNVPFIGYEIDSDYCAIAQRRIFDVAKD